MPRARIGERDVLGSVAQSMGNQLAPTAPRQTQHQGGEVSPGDQGGPFAKPPQVIVEATRVVVHSVRQRTQAAEAWPYMTSKPNRAIEGGGGIGE
jgi:hypothetical protein